FSRFRGRHSSKEMFGAVWAWAGRYRGVELNIGVAPHRIREETAKLCDDVWFWGSEAEDPPSVLERACRIHHRLAWIHPFRNGNGRHARLIADIYLKSYGEPMPVWPSTDIARKGGVRDEYLAALRAGDQGDFKPLMSLVSGFS
ncbi:MAG: mobile mystery protein B, partial [Elusimicrobiota bacterium]